MLQIPIVVTCRLLFLSLQSLLTARLDQDQTHLVVAPAEIRAMCFTFLLHSLKKSWSGIWHMFEAYFLLMPCRFIMCIWQALAQAFILHLAHLIDDLLSVWLSETCHALYIHDFIYALYTSLPGHCLWGLWKGLNFQKASRSTIVFSITVALYWNEVNLTLWWMCVCGAAAPQHLSHNN